MITDHLRYLSPRQLDVLKAILKGYCTRQSIADYMFVDKATVCSHLSKVYDILDLHTLAEIVYWVLRNTEAVESAVGMHYRKSSYQEAI
jgi:DNA-binding NarL/FixJ family response regulator